MNRPDEPKEVILEVIRKMTDEYTFVIPGSLSRLSEPMHKQLRSFPNVIIPGFLSKKDYERELCTSACAIVLTTREKCQPCGACEALSSNTPLIASQTSLIKTLFGDWAILVKNSSQDIIKALRALPGREIDLSEYLIA